MTSYLEVSVNQRQMLKIPLYEILNITTGTNLGNTPVAVDYRYIVKKKNLLYPIIINSLSTL